MGAEGVSNVADLGQRPPGQRDPRTLAGLGQILRGQFACETGRAVQDDVEFPL
jgi:hypothetical protein